MSSTRRSLLAAFAAASGFAKSKKHGFDRPLGVELYTLRNVLPKDASGSLRAIAAIGYKEVEGSTADLIQYTPLFKEFGLAAPAIHADTNAILNGGFEKTIEDAQTRGVKFIVMPYVMPE